VDLFEYQGKELFAAAGVEVLPSRVLGAGDDALAVAEGLGFPVAVKAQVLTGGRGKAGGVRVVSRPEELQSAVDAIGALRIKDKPVRAVLLEQGATVLRELYLAVALDRNAKSPVLIFSTRGGVDIEQVAAEEPGALLRLQLDAASADCGEQSREVVAAADLGSPALDEQLAAVSKAIEQREEAREKFFS